MRRLGRASCLLLVVCAALVAAAALAGEPAPPAAAWTLKRALKQIDHALKKLHGLTAEVQWKEQIGEEEVEGAGRVWVSLDGRLRGEVAGGNPRTVLVVPPAVHVYHPVRETAETLSLASNPDLLVQYALLGFAPAGSALKKRYDVSLIREDELDGQKTLLLTLTPISAALRAAVSTVMLWVDTTTWLPAQQIIRHGAGGLEVIVRYQHVTPANDLPEERFQPTWPAGTRLIQN